MVCDIIILAHRPLKDPGSDFISETHPHLWLEIAFTGSEAFT